MEVETPITKNPIGRPSSVFPPYDKTAYFNDYYLRNKRHVMCSCQQMVLNTNMSRHLKTAKHLTYNIIAEQARRLAEQDIPPCDII